MSRPFLEKWQVLYEATTDGEFNRLFPWRVQAAGDKIVVFNTEAQADAWIASVKREIAAKTKA